MKTIGIEKLQGKYVIKKGKGLHSYYLKSMYRNQPNWVCDYLYAKGYVSYATASMIARKLAE